MKIQRAKWRPSHIVFIFLVLLVNGPGFRGRAVLVEQGDEPAADDGTGGMLLGRFQSLPVADAESRSMARMGQSHLVYTVEVGLFGAVELFLCTGSGSRRYHVDKTVRVPVDETDTLFAGFRA